MRDTAFKRALRQMSPGTEVRVGGPFGSFTLHRDESRPAVFLICVNLQDASQIPAIAEPWFLAFDASVEFPAAMTLEDLKKAGPAIEDAIKKYGG